MTAVLSHRMHVADPAVDDEQLLTQALVHWQYHTQTQSTLTFELNHRL